VVMRYSFPSSPRHDQLWEIEIWFVSGLNASAAASSCLRKGAREEEEEDGSV
jgi:hypothetical protein